MAVNLAVTKPGDSLSQSSGFDSLHEHRHVLNRSKCDGHSGSKARSLDQPTASRDVDKTATSADSDWSLSERILPLTRRLPHDRGSPASCYLELADRGRVGPRNLVVQRPLPVFIG